MKFLVIDGFTFHRYISNRELWNALTVLHDNFFLYKDNQ